MRYMDKKDPPRARASIWLLPRLSSCIFPHLIHCVDIRGLQFRIGNPASNGRTFLCMKHHRDIHRCYPNILSCIYHRSHSILLNRTGNHMNNTYAPLYTRDLNNRSVADSSHRYIRKKWQLSNFLSSESRGTKPTMTERIL